jgi:hypothetical protein
LRTCPANRAVAIGLIELIPTTKDSSHSPAATPSSPNSTTSGASGSVVITTYLGRRSHDGGFQSGRQG